MELNDFELFGGLIDTLSDVFGYGDILNSKDPNKFEDLMNFGTIAGPDGKRIPGKEGRSEAERNRAIAKMLMSGKPMYIYKNGESYPYRVMYDPEKNDYQVDPKPINEMPEPEKVEKPSFFWRFVNVIANMYGVELPSARKYREYKDEMAARKNVADPDRIRRREYYTKHQKQQIEKYGLEEKALAKQTAEPTKEAEKVAEKVTEKVAEKVADKAPQNTKAQPQNKPEKAEKTLEEQLAELKAQQAIIEKKILERDGKLVNPNKPDLQFGKEKPETKTAVKSDLKPIKEVAAFLEEDKKDLDVISEEDEDELEEDELIDEKKKGAGLDNEEAPEANKEAPKSIVEIILEALTKDGAQITDVAKGNLMQLYNDSQIGKQQLEAAIKDPNVKKLAGGDAVKAMVAFENIKTSLAGGNKQEVLNALDNEGAAKKVQNLTKISKDVTYAADYLHDKSFFEKNFLNQEGLEKMNDTVTKSIREVVQKENLFGVKAKDPYYKSAVEAEKMANWDNMPESEKKKILEQKKQEEIKKKQQEQMKKKQEELKKSQKKMMEKNIKQQEKQMKVAAAKSAGPVL